MHPRPEGPRPLPGSITIEHEQDGRRVLCLLGDVDSAVVAHFETRHGRAPVVDEIDAGAVSFIGSAGISLLVRCAEASLAAARRPVLRAASHPVDRLMEQVGMEHLFPRPEASRRAGNADASWASTVTSPPDSREN